MMKKYITQGSMLEELTRPVPGCWINLESPTLEECAAIAQDYNVDLADVRAALDDEESSRVDVSNDYTLILFDIPSVEYRHEREAYTTIPLGIILAENVLVTVCAESTPVLKAFLENTVKEFSTKKQMRFIYQIFLRSCMLYQSYLRIVDRKRKEIESHIGEDTEELELIDLHELESNLVYFDTSLRANKVVLDRLMRYSRIKKYPEDQDLLEDVVVENQQAIEMTRIYRDIIQGTRELLSSVMDNRLNNAMKYLAAITIVMAIPTIISGIYGMNVDEKWMPFSDTPFGFAIICLIMLMICIVAIRVLKKRKML
ncbi:MAG: magnesium transporter CorA family protein [Eubacteriales bacterium]|nr:magnesium transporter CorA family protein [Eubacteriales bacterium]